MKPIIVDASVLGPLVIPDEAGDLLPAVAEALISGDVIVPQHWKLEVANLARMAVRRRRLEEAALPAILARLEELAIATDEETARMAWTRGVEFSRRHDLTAYDAAYLELAVRLGAPLATRDGALARAAVAEGVALLTQ